MSTIPFNSWNSNLLSPRRDGLKMEDWALVEITGMLRDPRALCPHHRGRAIVSQVHLGVEPHSEGQQSSLAARPHA